MKKKTIIIMASVVITLILIGILAYRVYLLKGDNSGLYTVNRTDYLINGITFLPEIAIVVTILAVFARKRWGFIFTILAAFLSVASLIGELFIKVVRLADVSGTNTIPEPCVPWLNIPIILICVLLFIMKFRLYTLPDEIKIKLKIVNLC